MMVEIAYRSIFPNNNIPKIQLKSTFDTTFENEITKAEASLSQYVDFSKIEHLMKEIEFKHLVEEDPASALLQKLKEIKNSEA